MPSRLSRPFCAPPADDRRDIRGHIIPKRFVMILGVVLWTTAGAPAGEFTATVFDGISGSMSQSNPSSSASVTQSSSSNAATIETSARVFGGSLGASANLSWGGSEARSNHTATATASSFDSIVVSRPGSEGQTLTVNYSFDVSGVLSVGTTGVGSAADAEVSFSYRLIVPGGEVVNTENRYGKHIVGIGNGETSMSESGDPATVGTHSFSTNLVVGQSYTLSLVLGTVVSDVEFLPTDTTRATADFSHTLLWGGVSSVTDMNGMAISDYTITSESGYNYAISPTPEPGLTLAAAACGLGGVAAVRRRLRATASPAVPGIG